jgi:hypothetical protein
MLAAPVIDRAMRSPVAGALPSVAGDPSEVCRRIASGALDGALGALLSSAPPSLSAEVRHALEERHRALVMLATGAPCR